MVEVADPDAMLAVEIGGDAEETLDVEPAVAVEVEGVEACAVEEAEHAFDLDEHAAVGQLHDLTCLVVEEAVVLCVDAQGQGLVGVGGWCGARQQEQAGNEGKRVEAEGI